MTSYVAKADSESKSGNQPEPHVRSKLVRFKNSHCLKIYFYSQHFKSIFYFEPIQSCASALAELAARRYSSAAKKFLAVSHEHFHYPELVSASNIAIYGGLTALATLSRKDLKEQVLHSANFKLFLELEPVMRETILGKTLIQQLWPQN